VGQQIHPDTASGSIDDQHGAVASSGEDTSLGFESFGEKHIGASGRRWIDEPPAVHVDVQEPNSDDAQGRTHRVVIFDAKGSAETVTAVGSEEPEASGAAGAFAACRQYASARRIDVQQPPGAGRGY